MLPAAQAANRNQLLRGEKSDNKPVKLGQRDQYSEGYAKRYKGGKRQPINLKKTGAFHQSIRADLVGKNITLTATDSKTEMLEKISGKNILGLSTQGEEDVRDAALEVLVDLTSKQLQL